MNNIALLVLEALWSSPKENHLQPNSLSFFEGIKKIVNGGISEGKLNIYSCNFLDTNSLKQAINYLTDTEEMTQLLYIGGHGSRNKIAGADLNKSIENIKKKSSKVKGIIISSCTIGENDSIANLLRPLELASKERTQTIYGANWVFCYKNEVDWFASLLIEASIIQTFSEAYIKHPKDLNSTRGLIDHFSKALSLFSHTYKLSTDKKENKFSLVDTIRIWSRVQGQEEPIETGQTHTFALIFTQR